MVSASVPRIAGVGSGRQGRPSVQRGRIDAGNMAREGYHGVLRGVAPGVIFVVTPARTAETVENRAVDRCVGPLPR